MQINTLRLAREIANPNLPIFQSRTLQSFVGQIYAKLSRWHGPAQRKHSALIQRISRLRARQEVPHPEILRIKTSEFDHMFEIVDAETIYWRSALAIKIYFSTGAKLRRVLCMRWDQIIDGKWYPYSPREREYWFMGMEVLDDTALQALAQAKERLAGESYRSSFVFPSGNPANDRPITNIRRYWLRLAKEMGWEGLPLSHIVRRYHERNTPSYIYMYRNLFVPMRRSILDPATVSKMTNQWDISA